ncbi:unnamed protein product, partial [Mycena citricolor]
MGISKRFWALQHEDRPQGPPAASSACPLRGKLSNIWKLMIVTYSMLVPSMQSKCEDQEELGLGQVPKTEKTHCETTIIKSRKDLTRSDRIQYLNWDARPTLGS